jgi:hypothetical protein
MKKKMYTVTDNKIEVYSADSLDEAMNFAKTYAGFVSIKSDNFEVVGRFGVDTVKDGKCPDGVTYDWNKASRIGATRRR